MKRSNSCVRRSLRSSRKSFTAAPSGSGSPGIKVDVVRHEPRTAVAVLEVHTAEVAAAGGENCFLLLDVHAVPSVRVGRVIVVIKRVAVVAQDPLPAALGERVAAEGGAVRSSW